MSMLKKLNNQIIEVKNEIKNFIENSEFEKAKEKKTELENLQNSLNLLIDIEDEEKKEITNKIENNQEVKIANSNNPISSDVGFGNVIKNISLGQKMNNETREFLNSMTAESEENGGLTIPKDISTKIKQLRRSKDSIENYVKVERVSTLSGTRVIEKLTTMTPFDNVDEEALFPDLPNPTFQNISYNITKKGGILKLSYELLSNTAENLTSFVIDWIVNKSRVTRNMLILKKLKEITTGKEVELNGIDEIKDIFNVSLNPAIAINSIVVTNQDGFNWLDQLKDADGRYLLQQNITESSTSRLFGRYPVIVLSNDTLKTESNEIPFYCGDLKEALTIFDREHLYIEFEANAGENWTKDLRAIKVREMLDIQAVDSSAVVKGYVTVTL